MSSTGPATTSASTSSSSPTSSSNSTIVPVGLDLSSVFTRIACCSATTGSSSTTTTTASVVSNTQGARWTMACVAQEEAQEDNNGSASSPPQRHYVFGDAALRMSNRFTLEEAVCQSTTTTPNPAAVAYLAYIIQLAADHAAVSVDQLRLVVTLPTKYATTDGTSTPPEQQLWLDCIMAAGKSIITDKKKRKDFMIYSVLPKAAVVASHYRDVASSTTTSKNILIMDMDQALEYTVLKKQAGVLEIPASTTTTTLSNISGSALITLLANFVATQFERQHKITRGEIMDGGSKKAKTKLIQEAERQLISGKTTMSFLLDGLYDGIDCNVNVSKPRWDMMTNSLLKEVEASLERSGLLNATTATIDVVLLSGVWATGLLKPLMERLFPGKVKTTMNGIVPEETVVVACAKEAGLYKLGMKPVTGMILKDVPVSPVAIGLCASEHETTGTNNGEEEILISEGTLLPCSMKTRVLEHACQLYQLKPTKIALANLTAGGCYTLELSAQGQLSIATQGQPLVTL